MLGKRIRSQITINYGTVTAYDEDLDTFTIDLWYYYGGFKGTGRGTLFDVKNNDLEKEIEEMLIYLLYDKQSEK